MTTENTTEQNPDALNAIDRVESMMANVGLPMRRVVLDDHANFALDLMVDALIWLDAKTDVDVKEQADRALEVFNVERIGATPQ